jgi:hypothetical protein
MSSLSVMLHQKHWLDWSISDLVSRYFNGADFQRSFLDRDMKLASDTALRFVVFTSVPFALFLGQPRALQERIKIVKSGDR